MTTYSEFDRDCAAMAIEAIDKKMAELWSTETFDAITEALKESELEDLRQERWEMWHIIYESNGR